MALFDKLRSALDRRARKGPPDTVELQRRKHREARKFAERERGPGWRQRRGNAAAAKRQK